MAEREVHRVQEKDYAGAQKHRYLRQLQRGNKSMGRPLTNDFVMPLSTSILTRLEHQHETVHELTKGFSEEQLRQRVNPDKWSVFQQLAHLASYQPVFLHRMQQIEQQHQPAFERYVADNDP